MPNSFDGHFPWETLRSIIGGRSAIDVPGLHVHDEQSAEEFLLCYGFDFSRSAHRVELEELRRDALDFLNDALLDPQEKIPTEIFAASDPRELLVWASTDYGSTQQLWACAVLRVAHTFAHSRSYFAERYGDEIRRQIVARFEPHLREEEGQTFLGIGIDLPLDEFEIKPPKPVASVAMKLLHKVENVAEDIFDRIGVRFITRTRFDALLVVRYLREHNVFMFANVKPSRSRNTLIDVDWLQTFMEGVEGAVEAGELSPAERLAVVREAMANRDYPEPPQPGYNPYSAANYHSLQFTCRQMIRVPDDTGRGEIRFFFPFEVQILDRASYELSRSGYASHEQYKARQRDAVRRRVLGPLVEQ